MDMKEICPCPKLSCPNHGYCDKCISKHLRSGSPNYCSFHTFLSFIKEVRDEDPESLTAKKLDKLIKSKLQAYEKLMDEHGLSQEGQDKLLQKVAEYSDHKK